MQELLAVVQGSSVVQGLVPRITPVSHLLHYVMAQGLTTLSPSCVMLAIR